MEANSVMTREVIVVPPELSLDVAWRVMQRRRIRHLPVVSSGILLGMLSDRDLLLCATLTDDGAIVAPPLPVATAMTLSPMTCTTESTVSSIAELMIERRIDAVPVVTSGDRIVGLVTSIDLLALLIEKDGARPLPLRFDVREGDEGDA